MKHRLFAALFLLFAAAPLRAQRTASNPLGGNLSVQDAGTCSTTGSFLWQQLPINAATTVVNLSGTFSGTLTIRLSTNGGGSWTTNSTTTTAGNTSISTNGFTDVCADVTTFTSGQFSVTISTGLNTGPQGPPGAGGGITQVNQPSPILGWNFGPNCNATAPLAAKCINTPGNTIITNSCDWTNASTTVTCFSTSIAASATVTNGNLATVFTAANPLTLGWHAAGGDTVVVSGFTGGDTIWNGTFTTLSATSTTITYTLSHANASSSTTGQIQNQSVGPFTSTAVDGGKIAWGYDSAVSASANACDPYQAQPQADFITATHVTISTVTSTTQAVISATPSTSSAGSKHGCVIFGSPDDAAADTLELAYLSDTSCPRVIHQAGNYLFTRRHFIFNPVPCANLPGQFPNGGIGGGGSAGNMFMSNGFELEGRGVGATVWFLPPDFPEAAGPLYGTSCTNGCFQVPSNGYFHDFEVTSGSGRGGIPTGVPLIGVGLGGVGTLAFFNCNGVGNNNSGDGTQAVLVGFQGQLQQVNTSACGTQGIRFVASTGNFSFPMAKCYRCYSENSLFSDYYVEAGAQVTFHTSGSFGTQNSTGVAGLFNLGGTVIFEDFDFFQTQANGTVSSPFGYICNAAATATCVATFKNVRFQGMQNQNGSSIFCGHVCDNYVLNSQLFSTGTGKTYSDVAGSRMFDLGGNQGNGVNGLGATGAVSISGSLFGTASIPATTSAATNFGTALTTQTVDATAPTGPVTLNLNIVQSLLGVSCTVASNTATPTVNWTGPGGTAESQALTALSISGVGALDSFQNDTLTISAKVGTAITFTMASALASTGCSPLPQYTVYAKVTQ